MRKIMQCSLLVFIVIMSIFSLSFAGDMAYQKVVDKAYALYKNNNDGKVPTYIPQLATVNPNNFAIALITAKGDIYYAGKSAMHFPIESISKLFTAALAMQEIGGKALQEKVGVNATGMPFNSIIAMRQEHDVAGNPLVNAGAISTVSLIKGSDREAIWKKILNNMNDFAGTTLYLNEKVFHSEQDTNYTNRAITALLYNAGRLYGDFDDSLYLYTKQCSVNVTVKELAVMGGTLANHGMNPVSHKPVISQKYVSKLLALMAIEGMYDNSGAWLYETGAPAKSGVGGGIVAVVPGQFAIAVYAPRLDRYGNSVRGQLAIKYIINALKVNMFSA